MRTNVNARVCVSESKELQICACYQFVIQWLRLKLRRGAPRLQRGSSVDRTARHAAHCSLQLQMTWQGQFVDLTLILFQLQLQTQFQSRFYYDISHIIMWELTILYRLPPLPSTLSLCHSKTRIGRRLNWLTFSDWRLSTVKIMRLYVWLANWFALIRVSGSLRLAWARTFASIEACSPPTPPPPPLQVGLRFLGFWYLKFWLYLLLADDLLGGSADRLAFQLITFVAILANSSRL